MLGTLNTLAGIAKQHWRPLTSRFRQALGRVPAGWLGGLQADGYVVVPGFRSPQTCQRLMAEVERIEVEHPDFLRIRSDRRVFGANRVSPLVRAFADDPDVEAVARSTYRCPEVSCVTLSQRLMYAGTNLGSGEGWHRDSHSPQFKAILYLTDVGPAQGPFEILPGSHRLSNLVLDTVQERIEGARKRFSEDEVARIAKRRYPLGVQTVTGPAGTLVLAVTSAIHRGRPIEAGARYALTNYFFRGGRVSPEVEAQFTVIPQQP